MSAATVAEVSVWMNESIGEPCSVSATIYRKEFWQREKYQKNERWWFERISAAFESVQLSKWRRLSKRETNFNRSDLFGMEV